MDNTQQVLTTVANAKQVAINFIVTYGFQILGALVVLTIGFFLSRWVGNAVMTALMRREMEPPIRSLISRACRLLVLLVAVIIALDTAGVQIAPLVAGLGVAGIGIGLALQGVLGNLVAGLFIIMIKPFRVGEYIEIHGEQGEVVNIELFSTMLAHPDRSRIIIPNRKIVGEILHNFGSVRQIPIMVGVAYSTDLNQALAVLREVVTANPRVIKDPAPIVAVRELGESSINIFVGAWVPVSQFGAARGELYKAIIEQFGAARVTIPFPQREIRILNETLPVASNK